MSSAVKRLAIWGICLLIVMPLLAGCAEPEKPKAQSGIYYEGPIKNQRKQSAQ